MTNSEATSETNWTTFAYAFLTIFVGFVGAPLVMAGGVLAWSAATGIGRALGAGCVFLAIAIQPVTWKRRVAGASFALAAAVCLGSALSARMPSAQDAPGGVQIVGRRPMALSPVRVVPEVDQLFVASTLLPWFSRDEPGDMTQLRDDIRAVYHEFDRDFESVPSLLDDAMRDECSGRSFVWPAPPSAGGVARPDRSLLFVHGYGGSWSGYLRVLRPVATELGATIVQPSCGVGRWTNDRELETFERFVVESDAAGAASPRVDVVALSNGGLALSRRIETVMEHADSVVLISPAFDLAALAAATHASRPIPVLVIHGTADARVSRAHVEAGIARLRRLRLEVRLVELEGADHFAFFRERAAIRREIEGFLGDAERPRGR